MQYFDVEGASEKEAIKKAKELYGPEIILGKMKRVGFFAHKKYILSVSVEDAKLDRYKASKFIKQKAIIQNSSQKMFINNEAKDENPKALLKQLLDSDVNKVLLEKLDKIEKELKNKQSGEPNKMHPNIECIVKILKENEFFDDFIDDVVNAINKELSLDDVSQLPVVQGFVYQYIANRLKFSSVEDYTEDYSQLDRKIFAFIGPTGIGKSTTVVKIAGNIIKQNKSSNIALSHLIKLITIDGYKIGGIEQMRKYANHLQTPFVSVERNEDLQKEIAISQAKYVLVDTTGRSQGDDEKIYEMQRLLASKFPVKYFLTISATTKPKEVRRIFETFCHYFKDIVGVIITKQDESSSIGAIINETINRKMSLAYITNGQKVPTNILKATKEEVMATISGLPAAVAMELDG